MKYFLTMVLVIAVILAMSTVASANVCAFDAVPAATLLFPFVEYDYAGGGVGGTTLISITNFSAEAQIVHVALWTDYSLPILDFNILLTGYDVQSINIRDILAHGMLPSAIPGGGNSPVGDPPISYGPVSEANVLTGAWIDGLMADPESTTVLTCNEGHPRDDVEGIDSATLDLLEALLMQSQAAGAREYSTCLDDPTRVVRTWWQDDVFNAARKTWMYITADVVTECTLMSPDDPSGDYLGLLSGNNVLTGDVIYLDPVNGFSEGVKAVHLEADPDLPSVATPLVNPANGGSSGYPISFYARYGHGLAAPWQYREPLGTAWGFKYFSDSTNSAESYLRVWKGTSWNRRLVDLELDSDDRNVSSFTALNCLAYTYYAWDEEENVYSLWDQPWGTTEPWESPNLLPLGTQEVNIDEFLLPDNYGSLLFVWPASNFEGIPGADATPDFYQTWMSMRYKAFGQFSLAMDGTLMANYNCFGTQVLPLLGIGHDYVDEGGFTN